MYGGGPEYLMMIVLIFLFDHDTITTQHITSHTQSGTILPQPLPLTFGLNFRLLDFWFEIFFLNFFFLIFVERGGGYVGNVELLQNVFCDAV